MTRGKWLTGVALVGGIASVLAVEMLWLVVTKPEVAAVTFNMWFGGMR